MSERDKTRSGIRGGPSASQPIVLRVVGGPLMGDRVAKGAAGAVAPVRCEPGSTVRIGRAAANELCLLSDAVSRRHGAVVDTGEGWVIVDQGSSSGTWVNGVRVEPGGSTPIGIGDLINVGGVLVRVAGSEEEGSVVHTVDDRRAAATMVERARVRLTAGRRLDALTALFDEVARLGDEDEITRVALRAALEGTGFGRAAFVRERGDESDALEIVAEIRRDALDAESAGKRPTTGVFSRSLVERASAGEVATLRLRGGGEVDVAASVVEMGVRSAVCAPVTTGGAGDAPEGLLYLDSSDVGGGAGGADDPTGYCVAVARVLALALGNARRARVEARQREMRGHLEAAREAQRAIMPGEEGRVGPLEYAVRMRPGLILAGDLFNAIELPGGRAAICLGDAAGHGPASAILMCAAQAFLQAELLAGRELGKALAALNDYVCSIRTGGRFVTLWVGVFDPDGALEYVDAGHGHVAVLRRDGSVEGAGAATAPPVGVAPGEWFEAARTSIEPGDVLILYSDGVVEQPNAEGDEFGRARLDEAAMQGTGKGPAELVRGLDDALVAFVGRSAWRDDATIAGVARVTA